MMTLMARLCALCAVCALMQMAIGDAQRGEGIAMIGGMLMLHLVISGIKELCEQILSSDSLMGIYTILIG